MRQDERESLRQRFQFRCGYCGVTERDIGAELTVDHFQPRSRGGSDDPENWVYCCHPCSEFKGNYWHSEPTQRILHPLRDPIGTHIVEQEDGTLRAYSETGAFHIERLRLNRPQLVAHRRERRLLEAAYHTHARLIEFLTELEGEVEALTSRLERLKDSDQDS